MRTNFVAQKMVLKGYQIEVEALSMQLAIKQDALDDCKTMNAQKDDIIIETAEKTHKIKQQRNILAVALGVLITGIILAK